MNILRQNSERIAGLDISKNKVGVAFSDIDGIFISFETTLKTSNYSFFRTQLQKLFQEYSPTITYIGLPLQNNLCSTSANFIKTFAHGIRDIIGKFEFIDESLTTFYAKAMVQDGSIKSFDSIDSIVARMLVLYKIKPIV